MTSRLYPPASARSRRRSTRAVWSAGGRSGIESGMPKSGSSTLVSFAVTRRDDSLRRKARGACLPPLRGCSDGFRRGDRAHQRDDQSCDEEEERDREKRGEVERRRTGRLREYALERTDQRLGDPVQPGDEWLV